MRVVPTQRGQYEVLHDDGRITKEWFNGTNWPELLGVWSASKWR